ncbi:Ger(x)C family spore germination protein [Gorillibacterium sp. sgz500922]|uniref:Ger(x)C family spore germination protein n=1 Tax=Gorillibacterium sp. sgz500922 TaxID=3446694 RepID=UPI003F660EE6
MPFSGSRSIRRRIKRLLAPALAAMACLPLAGCWNSQELNDLSVVLALGIDKAENGYSVTVQVVDPNQMSRNKSANRSPVTVYNEQASTIFEALRRMTTKASRRMYIAHLRFVIFNEEMARSGIEEPLDFLLRDHEVRPDFYMAIAKGSWNAADVLKMMTPTEVLPAMDLFKSLKVSQQAWAPTTAVSVTDFVGNLVKDGIDPVLTGLGYIGDLEQGKTEANVKEPQSPFEYKYEGVGVMHGDRLIGWLSENDSKAYNYIVNHITSTVGKITSPDSGKPFDVEVTHSRVEMEPYLKNGKPAMRLKSKIEGVIGEVGGPANLMNEAVLLRMQEAGRIKYEQILQHCLDRIQSDFKVDIFGFGEAFHRKYPRQWRRWKADWPDEFARMPIELETDYELKRMGKIISPFQGKE